MRVYYDETFPTNIVDTYDIGDGESNTKEENGHENEIELIDFIKQQENRCIENLLSDLEKDIGWKQNDDELLNEEDDLEINNDVTNTEILNGDTPVQPGHSLTMKMSVLLIWIYVITHSLTTCQVNDLLTLVNLHLIISNPTLNSIHRFKKFFSHMDLSAEKHFYCSHCTCAVAQNQIRCSNDSCGKDLHSKSAKNYFIELDIISQLKLFYHQADFIEGLKYRFQRSKKKQDNIEDVYDSSQYRRLFENNGPLSKPDNLTFTFNTDGVPIFKSSKTSIWPIFLMINELPYKMRKTREYMLLAGLWCGSTKPTMNFFLDPLCKTFDQLERGIQVLKNEKEWTRVQAFLMGVSCDIPARSAVLNINQHNGESCCIKCLQTGINHRTETGGNIRTFPYKIDDPAGTARTHEMVINNAREALESGKTVNGVKGPSVLMFCPEFDCVKNITIDYMHLVCLGVVRLMLKLWFNVSHSLNCFSLYRFVDIVDVRLENIKLPHFINRPPRTISEHLTYWKAAELRSWLMYYSVPCLTDLMRPNYLYHYCALVEGIFLLCKSSISAEDIEKSERLLKYFVFMFPALYGERYLTINVHSLIHLSTTVKELGPLWSSSCFAFEGANGELLQLFHGTQYIDMQIINAVKVFQMLPSLVSSIDEESIAYKYVKNMTGQNTTVVPQFSLLGKNYQKNLSDAEKLMVWNFLNRNVCSLKFYCRASIRGLVYHSMDYTRVLKRNSFSVKYVDKTKMCYGTVLWFAEPEPCEYLDKDIKFACIKKLKTVDGNLFGRNHEGILQDYHISSNFLGISLSHLNTLQKTNDMTIVDLSDIVDMCICIEMNDLVFFCEEPNHHEKNL